MRAEIKRVTVSYLNDILEISRHIWEGHDYLPSTIVDWFKDTKSYTCGVETDKRLVAVANLRLVENGKTGWMEGLRVHPEHRGEGFANALTEHIIQRAVKMGVRRLRFTTAIDNQASMKLAKKFGFKKTLEMSVFWHSNPQVISSIAEFLLITKSGPIEIYSLLQDNLDVIPDRVLFYDWKALDCTLEALKTVGKSHEFFIGMEKKKMTSLSYAYVRHEPEQQLWIFTIYALEPKSFLAQLSYNITEASKKNINAIMGTCEPNFRNFVKNLNWSPHEHWTIDMVLFEKIVKHG